MADDPVDPSELFSSPIKPSDLPGLSDTPKTPKTPTPNTHSEKEPFDADEVREAALRKELAGVRNINAVIEGVIGTLERAKGNMGSVSQTVNNASTLLNTWTRILSQTEHNQRLLRNPSWPGATRDVEEMEAEALERQLAERRRAEEAERRREEIKRKAEEQDRARLAGTSSAAGRGRGLRGTRTARGVMSTRGSRAGVGGSSAGGVGNSSSSSLGSRGGSQIGRGFGTGRTTRGTRASGRGVR